MKQTGLIIGALLAGNLLAAVVKPPAQIVTRGIPPIPATLAEKVKPYLAARAPRFQDWHPVKKHMLLTQRPKGGQVAQFYVLESRRASGRDRV